MKKIYWGDHPTIAQYDQAKFKEFLETSNLQEACTNNGKLKHIIRAEHFDLSFLETICNTANAARRIAKLEDKSLKKLLRAKSVLNYFSQPSRRTFLSFSMAESQLGMRREEVRDITTSSYAKGESEKDGLRTISSYFNALVCRHASDNYDAFAVWAMNITSRPIPVINAGSGTKEHPTQAILDYYTLRESFNGNLDGKTYTMVGDCQRSRTIHSRSKLLALHNNIRIIYVAPEEHQIDQETEDYVMSRGVKVEKVTSGLAGIPEISDEVNVTRIQNEYGHQGEPGMYDPQFIFQEAMLDQMTPGSILTHPLPKRNEIDPAIDYRKDDPKVMIWRAVRNGMWTRTAIFAYLFDVENEIIHQYEKIQRSAAPKPL